VSDRAFVARFSPWRTLLGVAGAVGFVALGVVLGRIDEPLAPVIGYGCAAVFGVFAVIGLARIGRRGPALQIDAAGIRRWFGRGERLIPWSAVETVEEVTIHRQHYLAIWLHEPDRWIGRRALGDAFGHLSLSTHATDRRFADLRAAVIRFAPATTLRRLTSDPDPR
jgi:hypothetical protein